MFGRYYLLDRYIRIFDGDIYSIVRKTHHNSTRVEISEADHANLLAIEPRNRKFTLFYQKQLEQFFLFKQQQQDEST